MMLVYTIYRLDELSSLMKSKIILKLIKNIFGKMKFAGLKIHHSNLFCGKLESPLSLKE